MFLGLANDKSCVDYTSAYNNTTDIGLYLCFFKSHVNPTGYLKWYYTKIASFDMYFFRIFTHPSGKGCLLRLTKFFTFNLIRDISGKKPIYRNWANLFNDVLHTTIYANIDK